MSSRAFLYDHSSFIGVNILIDPPSGWVIEEATAINDVGRIVGTACRSGACQAVRLDLVAAVPEPAT